jgi:3-dehydroquinate dehydratase-1
MLKPKICAPVTGRNIEEIEHDIGTADAYLADIIEWRADYFSEIKNGFGGETQEALKIVGEDKKPVIFTLRAQDEGGAAKIAQDTRRGIMLDAINSGAIQYIDIEYANGAEFITPLAEAAHRRNVKVIISGHDFSKTPERDEIVSLLCKYGENFADLVKIAVMPQCTTDVFVLLSAALKYSEGNGSLPLIAVSMGETGLISRIYGGLFGSVITFGHLGKETAPGQVSVWELKKMTREVYPK